MSLPTTEISKELQLQTEYNRELHDGIIFGKPEVIDNALAKGANPTEHAIFKSGKKATRTPLANAVYYSNLHAVRKLIKYYNVNEESCEIPLFLKAVDLGDTDIIHEFLKAGIDINTYFYMNALSQSILSLSTIALIYQNTIWSSTTNETHKEIQQKLEDWYNDTDTNLPNGVFKVKFYGDKSTITLLLDKHINVHMPDGDNVTPLMLCQTPEKYTTFFITANNEKELKYLSDQDHILTFTRTMTSRNLKKKLEVTVEYDFSHILSLIQAHIASLQAYSPVSRKSIEGMVKKSEEKTLEELYSLKTKTHEKITTLDTKVTPMYKAYTETSARDQKIKNMKNENNGAAAFYNELSIGLNGVLAAFKVLDTGMVQRAQYTGLDKGADALSFLSEHVPAPFGTATKLVAAITQKISDIREENKHKRVTRRVELDHLPQCEDFALAIAELYKDKLSKCTDANATKMAKEALAIALICLNDDVKFDRTKPVVEQLVEAVKTSTQFTKQLDKLLQKQQSQSQPLSKAKKKTEACAMM